MHRSNGFSDFLNREKLQKVLSKRRPFKRKDAQADRKNGRRWEELPALFCSTFCASLSILQFCRSVTQNLKKSERENRVKERRQLVMEAVRNRAACALPCLGSNRWRSWEGAFPTLQSNAVSEVNGDKKASGHPIPRAPCSRSVSRELQPGRAAAGASTSPCSGLCQQSPRKMGSPSSDGNGWQSRE